MEEIYPEWAAFMQIMLHGCKVSKKIQPDKIVNNIKHYQEESELKTLQESYDKITDLLRASYICTTPD